MRAGLVGVGASAGCGMADRAIVSNLALFLRGQLLGGLAFANAAAAAAAVGALAVAPKNDLLEDGLLPSAGAGLHLHGENNLVLLELVVRDHVIRLGLIILVAPHHRDERVLRA